MCPAHGDFFLKQIYFILMDFFRYHYTHAQPDGSELLEDNLLLKQDKCRNPI